MIIIVMVIVMVSIYIHSPKMFITMVLGRYYSYPFYQQRKMRSREVKLFIHVTKN